MTVADVLAALERVTGHRPRRSGTEWTARCPAHDDRRASLTVREGRDGRILIYCHARCSFGAILDAARLKPRDLGGREDRQRRPSVVATYDYCDERGELVFQVVRREGKRFAQRRPDGNGGWTWNLGGARRLLYRLPRVLEAVASGAVVFVVEGERDVESLEQLGLVATCNPMGAGKWRAAYATGLSGARVVVLPDADHAGRKHGATVARSLATAGVAVKLLELHPERDDGSDVSDWLADADTAEEARATLIELVRAAPRYDASAPQGSTPLDSPTDREDSQARPQSTGSAWTPPELDPAAFHGIAGRWCEAVAPYTEAHPAGILASFLVAAGNAVGPTPHCMVGPRRHGVNEYVALVGPSATGRKGDGAAAGMLPVRQSDAAWASDRIRSGFGSGEGVIRWVQDKPDEEAPHDRRLLMNEGELAAPLAVAGRDGSTLSSLLRNAWDGAPLENHTKAGTMRATGAHVSVLACVTPEELRRRLTATELANGFANRFLFVAVARVQLLPRGRRIPETLTSEYANALRDLFAGARKTSRLDFAEGGGAVWDDAYRSDLSVERTGMTGAVTSRAESHALRLAMLYSLLDGRTKIEAEHVRAALAFWNYCEASARLVWGDSLGDPTADAILSAVREAGQLTRTGVRDLFSRHRSGDYERALSELVSAGRLRVDTVEGGGRPTSVYSLPGDESDRSDESWVS
jgi:5S rRNA maturation endonuclease (ribonuclease M5)